MELSVWNNPCVLSAQVELCGIARVLCLLRWNSLYGITRVFCLLRWNSLFDSEAGSDVIFLVGPEQWRFPGNRAVLADANSVFRAMLHGPMASQDTTIPIEDVDGRAFDNLLR